MNDLEKSLEKIKIQLPEGVVLGKFRPVSYHHVGMDMIDVLSADKSLTNWWMGTIFLEPCRDHVTNKLAGFHLVNAKFLRGLKENKNVFKMLLKAAYMDLFKNPGKEASNKVVLKLYLEAAWLLLRYPRMWKLSS